MKKPSTKRQHVTFYRSFFEAISSLDSKEEQADLYNAIFELSFNFSAPKDEKKLNKIVWTLIKPNVLTGCKNYINGCKPKRSDASTQSEATTSISYSISNSKNCKNDAKKPKKSKKVKKNIEYTPEFESFWRIYPKRSSCSKFKSFEAYGISLGLVSHERLYSAAKTYKSTSGDDPYRKGCVPFLNQRMWETIEEVPQSDNPFKGRQAHG